MGRIARADEEAKRTSQCRIWVACAAEPSQVSAGLGVSLETVAVVSHRGGLLTSTRRESGAQLLLHDPVCTWSGKQAVRAADTNADRQGTERSKSTEGRNTEKSHVVPAAPLPSYHSHLCFCYQN